jgi:hypothetical protein
MLHPPRRALRLLGSNEVHVILKIRELIAHEDSSAFAKCAEIKFLGPDSPTSGECSLPRLPVPRRVQDPALSASPGILRQGELFMPPFAVITVDVGLGLKKQFDTREQNELCDRIDSDALPEFRSRSCAK